MLVTVERVLIWENSMIWSDQYFFFFLNRTVWHKLTYIYSVSTNQNFKVNGFLHRIEDDIMQHFLQTISSKVKVWKTHFNSICRTYGWHALPSLMSWFGNGEAIVWPSGLVLSSALSISVRGQLHLFQFWDPSFTVCCCAAQTSKAEFHLVPIHSQQLGIFPGQW